MLVSTAVGRIFDHLAKAELTLPTDQLPWRSGPVVRGLRLLPVRYELNGGVGRGVAGAGLDGGSHRGMDAVGTPVGSGGDSQLKGLLGALRRLMFGGK